MLDDEIIYKLFAQRIMEFKPYVVSKYFDYKFGADPHFPPGYPFFLAITGWLGGVDQFQAMKIANIVASTLVLFPVYGITKELTSKSAALGAALVASVVPYQFLFPVVLMAENISVTLTVTAFYLAIRSGKSGNSHAIIFGLCLAANYLTKYSFLPVAPFPVLLFAIRQWLNSNPDLSLQMRVTPVIRSLFVAFLAFLALVGVWIAYAKFSDLSIKNALGFSPELVSLDNSITKSHFILLVYIVLQFSAAICAILPVFLPVLLGFVSGPEKRATAGKSIVLYKWIMALFVPGMGAFFGYYMWNFNYYFAAMNHVASVDITNLQQAAGERYTMFNFCLLLPLAFLGIDRLLTGRRSTRSVLIFLLLGFLSVLLSYVVLQILFKQNPWPVAGYITLSWAMAPDIVYGVVGHNPVYLSAAVFGGMALVGLVPWIFHEKTISKYKINAVAITIIAVAISCLAASDGIKTKEFALDSSVMKNNSENGRSIAALVKRSNPAGERIIFAFSKSASEEITRQSGLPYTDAYWSSIISFWTNKSVTMVSAESIAAMSSGNRFLISLEGDTAGPPSAAIESFDAYGRKFTFTRF
ncbi:ArnT family glycosyltransferase [Actimicrobium sp. GrIS 1.19]|uniref:ArnT family glycosyltransferase n=1 Tax=Actimicrobium sp. GrIS 1.19 TaxID=3071708 RepID=UPI002E15920A